jgi:hypothetical protein
MAPVRETIRNTASRLVGVLKEKAQFQYREGHLKFKTYARVFKVCHFPSTTNQTVTNHRHSGLSRIQLPTSSRPD